MFFNKTIKSVLPISLGIVSIGFNIYLYFDNKRLLKELYKHAKAVNETLESHKNSILSANKRADCMELYKNAVDEAMIENMGVEKWEKIKSETMVPF